MIKIILLLCLFVASPAWATVLISENWDSGTPPACWPCKQTPCTSTFNGWDGDPPGELGGTGTIPEAGLVTDIYHSAPRSFRQFKRTSGNDACNISIAIPGNPTVLHLRFYIYFTTDWNSYGNGSGLVHWIFTNTAQSQTGFRFNIYENSEWDVCPSGDACVLPQGSGGNNEWYFTSKVNPDWPAGIDLKTLIGRWTCIEYRMEISGSNVILTEWIDGVNVRGGPFTGPGSDHGYFDLLIISAYMNNPIASNISYYLDDIVLADSYIGPMGGDTTPPTVTAFTITPTTYTSLTVPIATFTATDNVGVTGYCLTESATAPTYVTCPGSTWSSSAPTAYTFSTDGNKTLYAWAKDAANNISTSLNDTILVDTTGPVVTITSPTSGTEYSTNSTTLTVGGTASDATSVSSITYANNRGGSGSCTGTTAWSCANISLYLGSNVLTITGSDGTYTGSDTLTVTFTDITSPTTVITTPTSGTTYTTTGPIISLSGTASDNVAVSSVSFANAAGNSGSCTGTTSWTCSGITLVLGPTNVVTITTLDSSGNSGTDSITITRLEGGSGGVTIPGGVRIQ
jgi:hypothetical protein